jgi:hypothetical protein
VPDATAVEMPGEWVAEHVPVILEVLQGPE